MVFQNIEQIFRSLWTYKSFSLVDIAGMSIVVAAIIIIFLIADYEQGFDTFYTGNDIYGIVSDLILIALIIASAIAGYSINRWLQDFAYRVDINWWIFALAGSLALLIALVTLGFQAMRQRFEK
jgi:hypothetical protein